MTTNQRRFFQITGYTIIVSALTILIVTIGKGKRNKHKASNFYAYDFTRMEIDLTKLSYYYNNNDVNLVPVVLKIDVFLNGYGLATPDIYGINSSGFRINLPIAYLDTYDSYDNGLRIENWSDYSIKTIDPANLTRSTQIKDLLSYYPTGTIVINAVPYSDKIHMSYKITYSGTAPGPPAGVDVDRLLRIDPIPPGNPYLR